MNQDIFYFEQKGFDFITLLWASLLEFNAEEKIKLLDHLSVLLAKHGILVVDTLDSYVQPPHRSISLNQHLDDENYRVWTNYGETYFHLFSLSELKQAFNRLNLMLFDEIKFNCKEKEPRTMFILTKSK